jgi:hypothetical protein
MTLRHAARLGALLALALASAACASSGRMQAASVAAAAPGVPEFHDAEIGADSLRSRLKVE